MEVRNNKKTRQTRQDKQNSEARTRTNKHTHTHTHAYIHRQANEGRIVFTRTTTKLIYY